MQQISLKSIKYLSLPENLTQLVIFASFIILLCGKILIPTSSGYGTQVYIWLLFPTLILLIKNSSNLHNANHKVIISLALFLTWYALSSIWSDNAKSITKYYKYSTYIAIFSLAFISHRKNIETFLTSAKASIVIISSICLVSSIYIFWVNPEISFRGYRIQEFPFPFLGGFTNPIIFGNYLGTLASMSLAILLYTPTNIQKTIYGTCYFSILCSLALTGSRGPILAHIITAFIVLNIKFNKLFIPLLLATAAFFIYIVSSTSNLNNLSFSDSFNIEQFLNSIFTYRPVTWIQAFRQILESPIIGYGADAHFYAYIPQLNFDATHPHNGFLLITYETGIIGLALFLITMTYTGITLLKEYKLSDGARIGFSLMIFSLSTMITDVHKVVSAPHAYWIMIWLPCSIAIYYGDIIKLRKRNAVGVRT